MGSAGSGVRPVSPALADGFFTPEPPGKPSVQFSSVAQSCQTLWDPMGCSTPGLPVHHRLPGSPNSFLYIHSKEHFQNCVSQGLEEVLRALLQGVFGHVTVGWLVKSEIHRVSWEFYKRLKLLSPHSLFFREASDLLSRSSRWLNLAPPDEQGSSPLTKVNWLWTWFTSTKFLHSNSWERVWLNNWRLSPCQVHASKDHHEVC